MLKKILKRLGIFILLLAWFLSGGPVIWPLGQLGVNTIRIPPKIKEVQAAHTLDTSAKAASLQTTNPATLSYTCGAGTTVLVVMLAHTQASRTGGAPTYNGVAMTQVGSEVLNAQEVGSEMWYLIDPPTGSAYTISVPNSGSGSIRIYAASFKAQSGYTSALDVSSSTNVDALNPSQALTTTVNGDAVVDILADGYASVPTARSHTLISNADEGAWVNETQYSLQATLGLITLSHTIASDDVAMIAAAFKEVLKTTTLGNGASEPSNVTIGPGAAATDLDNFTLQTNVSTDTVTAATVTLGPANAYNNIAQVDITDTSNVAKCTAVTNPTSNTITFSNCSISVTTTQTTYKVRVTPKIHANMPTPPGASYATTGTVTAYTCTNAKAGTDSGSATVTIDNTSPANVTSASGTAGVEQVSLSWTNPGDGDFNSSIVLRRAGTAVGDTPVEGTTYSVGNTIGSSTVACVVAIPTASCTDTGLTGGIAYHYKIFTKDTNGNYSASGVVPTGSPFTPTAKVVSVTITTDGTVAYGTLDFGGQKSTIDLSDAQTAKNDGNVAEDFTITTSNASGGTGWTLNASPDVNKFVHEFSTSGEGGWTKFITADSYQPFVTNIAANGTQNFDLRLTAPSSSDAVSKTIIVTILATQH